jgi:hypothetical protein
MFSPSSIAQSKRDFFSPSTQWQFSGIRLVNPHPL